MWLIRLLVSLVFGVVALAFAVARGAFKLVLLVPLALIIFLGLTAAGVSVGLLLAFGFLFLLVGVIVCLVAHVF